ncbi:hypothetical protein [Candidatus Electronema sp. JM]|uniref:hypothetical protein n=1 Tax=Candidatus Electronema sp. JM TaxID=3401571 RepID=UPI003AA7E2DB
MLKWIIDNKDWLFDGVLVAVPLAIIGWICAKQGEGANNIGSHNTAGGNQTITIDSSVHQTHSGSGDNAGKDKTTKV